VFALSLFAGATASAVYASDNADFYDDRLKNVCDRGSVIEDLCDDVEAVRDSEGATAVSYIVLVMFIISMYISTSCLYTHIFIKLFNTFIELL